MELDLTAFAWLSTNEFASAWIRFREKLMAPETTLRAYSSDLNDYLRWCASVGHNAFKVGPLDVAEYVTEQRQRPRTRGQRKAEGAATGLSAATIFRRLTTLRLWYDYLSDLEAVSKNPFPFSIGRNRRGGLTKPVQTPWIPTSTEWERLLELLVDEPMRNRLMFLLSYECALRRKEVCTLSLNDVDHALRTITIRSKKSKSRMDRTLPISRETAALLVRFERTLPYSIESDGQLFRSLSQRNAGAAITASSWTKVIEKLRDRAHLPQFHPHTLRHLALTDLARAGWNILEIKDFAGHRNIASTQLYISLSAYDLAAAFERTANSLFVHRRRQAENVVNG